MPGHGSSCRVAGLLALSWSLLRRLLKKANLYGAKLQFPEAGRQKDAFLCGFHGFNVSL